LKLQGRIRNALIRPVLSFDQVFGCAVLEQASRFETDGACVGMSSYVLDRTTTETTTEWLMRDEKYSI
jgi:hypothetical protein